MAACEVGRVFDGHPSIFIRQVRQDLPKNARPMFVESDGHITAGRGNDCLSTEQVHASSKHYSCLTYTSSQHILLAAALLTS
jgi:hypothetical protein